MSIFQTTARLGALCVALTGCGNMNEGVSPFKVAGEIVTGLVGASDSPEGAPAPALTREVIEAQDTELLRVSIISREATGLIVFGGRNGDNVTWLSPDGLGLTFNNGLLAGTRGFGDDVMGSDLSGAIASLDGGGNHTRTLDFLNGLSQIERLTFQCVTTETGREDLTIVERTYDTTILEETCSSEIGSFKNTYWRASDGVIWQSRQWISAGVGYLGYQRL